MLRKVIGIVWFACIVASCGKDEPSNSQGIKPLWVKTQLIENSPAIALETYSGTVMAHKQARVSSEVQARIIERRVKPGDVVREGDILFLLDKKALSQVVNRSHAEVTVSEIKRDTANAELLRFGQLRVKGVVSVQSFELAERTLRARIAQVDAANANLRLSEKRLENAVIRAPFDGVVISVAAEVGQVAVSGETLATVADLQPREIEVNLPEFVTAPETALAYFYAGAPLTVTLAEVDGALNKESLTWRARYVLPVDSSPALGSLVRLQAAVQTYNNAVYRVPATAVDERGSGAQVWYINGGKAEPLTIKLESLFGESAIISGNLKSGTRVIAMGTHLLSRGLEVKELSQ